MFYSKSLGIAKARELIPGPEWGGGKYRRDI